MVVAYLRVSTGKQHLENQEGEILRYAKSKDLVIDHWVTETVSGKKDRNSRRLGATIRKLKKGDVLIVTELSRLSRSLHEIMIVMKHCIDTEVTIHSTKDGLTFDDSLNSKVLSFAFGLAAEIEHKLISQRTKEAIAVRKASGKPVGRKSGTDVKIRQLHSKETKILTMIQEGISITKICTSCGVAQSTFWRFRRNNENIRIAIRSRRKKCREIKEASLTVTSLSF